MLEFKEKETKNVEKLIGMVAENQKFGAADDNLSTVIKKFDAYMDTELTEEELDFVAAAVKPAVPKYKSMKNN